MAHHYTKQRPTEPGFYWWRADSMEGVTWLEEYEGGLRDDVTFETLEELIERYSIVGWYRQGD